MNEHMLLANLQYSKVLHSGPRRRGLLRQVGGGRGSIPTLQIFTRYGEVVTGPHSRSKKGKVLLSEP